MSGRLRRDLLVAVFAGWLVFSTVYVFGRLFLAGVGERLAEVPVAAADEVAAPAPSVDGLRADLASTEQPAALIEARGAIDGRLVLDRGQSNVALFGNPFGVDPDEPALDLDVRFSGRDATLRIVAEGITVGETRTGRMTVVIAAGPQTFNARPGMCALEMSEIDYVTISRPWGQVVLPSFSGQLVCIDVPELRSGENASFTVVFAYEEH